jgi:hypothetical protein
VAWPVVLVSATLFPAIAAVVVVVVVATVTVTVTVTATTRDWYAALELLNPFC